MRLVKIKLCPQTPFWFLGEIVCLSKDNPTSPLINVDSLEDHDIKTINQSVRNLEIKLFDGNEDRISKIDDARFVSGEYAVSIDDIEEESTSDFSKINSVTISDEEEELKEEEIQVTDQDLREANLILSKNGNTVRKMIKAMSKNKDRLALLHACLQIESIEKARPSIIKEIEEVINERQPTN